MIRVLFIAVFVAVVAGCNPSPPPQFPVHGQILLNGQPLRGGTVVFTPDEKRGARGLVAFATLDSDGRFVLHTDRGEGAVRGWHRITVAPPPDSSELIGGLERYRHPDHSGLEFEVQAGRENNAILKLEWEQ